jgi:hypothetical protein
MKPITIVVASLLISVTAHAQTATKATTRASNGAKKVYKNAVGGTIKDLRRQPLPKLQAYLYRNDTLIGSGYTSSEGAFETSNVPPGTYALRIVYPATGKRITITGVPVKLKTITPVNLMVNQPVEDSTITYTEIAPKTEVKK